MHFTERLNKLIEDLGADTKTIAAFAGFRVVKAFGVDVLPADEQGFE